MDASALFDVQVKRIHEYKRQFMNILSVAYRYLRLVSLLEGGETEADVRLRAVPRVVIFAGKAAPNYSVAKDIIRMILAVAETVNGDPRIGGLLKVVFIPNYNVSLAELIIPASDLNQQISTAGMEASGTSNMKFCMNGSLLLGSRDGANLEIERCVGKDNIFMFGATAKEVQALQVSQVEITTFLFPPSSLSLSRWLSFCTSLAEKDHAFEDRRAPMMGKQERGD